MDISEVCGERTASALSEIYGNEAVAVVENLDINRLLQVPGLGKKKALSIVRRSYAEKHGNGFEGLLGGSAEKAYEKVLSLLQSYVMTDEGKNLVYSYFPVLERDTIEGRLDYFEEALQRYREIGTDYEAVSRELGRISKLKDAQRKKYYDYVIITDSSLAEKSIKNDLCDSMFASTPADAEYAQGSYSFVVYAYGEDSELMEHIEGCADMIVEHSSFRIDDVVPDATVERFLANEETLDAVMRLNTLSGREPSFLESLLPLLREHRERDTFSEKKVSPQEFIDLVREKEKELNKMIGSSIGSSDFGIKADRLLELLSTLESTEDPTEALKRNLPPEFDEKYQELLRGILQEIEGSTGIDATALFPEAFSYPISVDTEKLYELKNDLESSDFKSKYDLKRRIASYGNKFRDLQEDLLGIYELDFKLGIGRFIHENSCTRPQIVESGTSFIEGKSLFIDAATPVSYRIGATGHDIATDDNVVVLTGANSGGKTTLLESVLVNQILTQMGMFVPAEEMQTTIYESIRYLAKAKSQNAGAFETTIKSLVPMAIEKGKRLVLIDELESITEPGSAARIIAALIEILQENTSSCAIIVTHLGEEISELCRVRVDGITATGLDDDLNLIVERQPEFGTIGKSTPELIVEKLFRKSKGDKKKVYERMLEKLKE